MKTVIREGPFIKHNTSGDFMVNKNIFGGSLLTINADESIFISSIVNFNFNKGFAAVISDP